MRVESALRRASQTLATAGVDAPRLNATWLACAACDVAPAQLVLLEELPPEIEPQYWRLVERRAAREPLQHILGTAPFRHIEVAVGPGVFVPRPETELLVDAVLAALHSVTAPVVVDLCAGSGALGLAIAREVPTAQVHAVELAPEALTWLRRNTAGTAVQVIAADVADPEPLSHLQGTVDVVVSNPPYVPSATPVDPEVRADPVEAVFAGEHGLALMPDVIARSAELLRAGGVVAIEHDDSQGESVPALLAADGRWVDVMDHADLAGRPRYVTGQRV
jgi:release factor glutamine methyltransferase